MRDGRNEGEVGKGYKLSVIRLIHSEDLRYSMVTIVSNSILYTGSLLRE